MKKPKQAPEAPTKRPQQQTKAITIRLPLALLAKLQADADAQDWSVNAEINHRLRAGPVLDQLRSMSEEITELKSLVRALQRAQLP